MRHWGHLRYRVGCRWQRWLAVRRAEARLADCLTTRASFDELAKAYQQLREARES